MVNNNFLTELQPKLSMSSQTLRIHQDDHRTFDLLLQTTLYKGCKLTSLFKLLTFVMEGVSVRKEEQHEYFDLLQIARKRKIIPRP